VGCSENGILRLRPERVNHVWSYDFVVDRTEDGRRIKILGVMDEYSRECLALAAGRHFRSQDVCSTLEDLIEIYGRPEHIRSDNGPELVADSVRNWLGSRKIGTLYIAPGAPWENAYIESFFGGLRRDLLDLEAFASLQEAQVLLELHRRKYNEYRPHRSRAMVESCVRGKNEGGVS
jgi:transposase InsO family protein